MEKIYEHADDLHVVATKLYATADDGYVYKESTATNKVSKSELEEYFVKGTLITFNGAMYYPVRFKAETTYSVVTVCADSAEYNFYSSEYTA